MTVIVTAGLVRARASNSRLAFVISGSGSGSTGMIGGGATDVVAVVVVDVVVVVVDVVVVVVAGGLVVAGDVVVADGVVVASTIGSTGGVSRELAVDWPEQAVVRRSPTRRTTDFQRTPSR